MIKSELFNRKIQFEGEFRREIAMLRSHYATLDLEMRDHYEKMSKKAKKLEKQAFDEAKEICWYLPSLNDQQNALYCFWSYNRSCLCE